VRRWRPGSEGVEEPTEKKKDQREKESEEENERTLDRYRSSGDR
jgi:hypothetical protein